MIDFIKNIFLLIVFVLLIAVLSTPSRVSVTLPETIPKAKEIVIEKPVEKIEEEPVVEKKTVIDKPLIKEKPIIPEDPITIVIPPTVLPISFSQINTSVRESVVNILCSPNGSLLNPISGSGVLIRDTGVILTNAHIAQYYLLQDYADIDCVIRVGSPAIPLYRASLLHISSQWVESNANLLIQENPKGTGEFDYALLYINERTDKTKTLPKVFPYTPFSITAKIDIEDGVLVAGYPAGFLGGLTIQKALYAASSVASINKLFTFKDGDLDLISVGGSVVAQKGSSGGAIVNRNNELIGIVVTSTLEETTEERDLRAITMEYIHRDFLRYTGKILADFIDGDLESQTALFASSTAPLLSTLLTDALNR